MTDETIATPAARNTPYREITDAGGRVYRVGESDRQILGLPRWTMVALPWAAMHAISVFEYAFGAGCSGGPWTRPPDVPRVKRPSGGLRHRAAA